MAALNSFTDELESQLTCVICNEILTEPKTLPCLHTFCYKCIESWNQTCQKQMKTLRCPTCRAEVNVDGEDVTKLPSSFTYNSLLQLFNFMKIKTDECNQQQLPECVSCLERSVLVGFCPQCEGMICDECINNHKTINPLKRTHDATLWSEFKMRNVNSYISNQAFCKEKFHQKCHLDYHCQTCRKCICQKCAATAHSSHEKISVEEAAENAKKLIRKDKEELNGLLIKYMKEFELSNKNMRRIQSEVDAAKTNIRKNTQALIKTLQDQEDALISNLEAIVVEQTIANEEEKNEIEAKIEQVTELKNQCEKMEDEYLQFILDSFENLRDVCKTTLQNKSILSTQPVKRNLTVRYIPNPEVNIVMQNVNVGKLVESVTDPSRCSMEFVSNARCGFINWFLIVTRDSEGNVCYTSKDSIDVQIQDGDKNDVQKELIETETGKFQVKYEAEKPSPYKIVVRIGGKEIKNSPQNIDAVDAKAEFKPLRVIDVKEISRPISLSLSERGDIAVLNNDHNKTEFRVVLFNADGEYLRTIGGVGSGDGQLSNPHAVVFSEDKILVSDNPHNGGCIKEFDIDGTYKRTFCKQPKRVYLTAMCTANEMIACLRYNSSTKETCIKLIDKDNCDQLHDIRLNVPNDRHKQPLFMTYDNKKFFLSFMGRQTVYVFDDNGRLLSIFGKQGNQEGQFDAVRGLTVFGEDMLLVCDLNNQRVQVFNQDGDFISSFGSYGSGLGQMNGPFDVTVQGGRVFVLERDGKRVQVWS
ncbi:RING finger protein nhl-1-like [Exaiptasia diaphana]|uniref:Uncharacterized protein n=1 Tax=Exaiptasia diaphana TaxID=2652724 RepID=A0A913XWD9_EXADI|nr:RING finger protein nhl-1-like [Exaiptasia diaphana]